MSNDYLWKINNRVKLVIPNWIHVLCWSTVNSQWTSGWFNPVLELCACFGQGSIVFLPHTCNQREMRCGPPAWSKQATLCTFVFTYLHLVNMMCFSQWTLLWQTINLVTRVPVAVYWMLWLRWFTLWQISCEVSHLASCRLLSESPR